MKRKYSIIILIVILFFSFNISFAQTVGVLSNQDVYQDKDGKVFVDINKLSQLLGFNYTQNQGQIEISKSSLTVDEVINKVTKSVVAIIGDSKNIKADDFYYSKIPAGLTHGSGVVVDSNGLIITNNHVIEDMKQPYVIFYDSKAYKATILYSNKEIDLALLKVNRSNLTPIEFENTKNIKVGMQVLAIGTPLFLGWRNTVTQGIISGLNRPVEETYTYLQTDASINPGNSGGPLVDMEGKLVGVNALGVVYYQGINFAIPVDNVRYFLEHYKKYGKIKRCYTGLEFEDSWLSYVGLPSNQGLKIVNIKKDSPLYGKVQEGDTLILIDNVPINSIAEYNEALKKYLPNDKAILKFKRGNNVFEFQIVLKEYPSK